MKIILLTILLILLAYPFWNIIEVREALEPNTGIAVALNNYRISIWLSWVVFVSVAVYYKWTRKENTFFKITYFYILTAVILYGYYHYKYILIMNYPSTFTNLYTGSILAALRDALPLIILTAFLQISVWWYSQKWHRE